MYRYHEIVVSRAQQQLAAGAHLLGALTIFFYLEATLLKYALLAAICLAAIDTYRRLIRQGNIRLRVDPGRDLIEFQQFGQPYFYRKYKVYQSRWFAILKLIDQRKDRTLILNPDCFHSVESYRQLRFELRQLERVDAT